MQSLQLRGEPPVARSIHDTDMKKEKKKRLNQVTVKSAKGEQGIFELGNLIQQLAKQTKKRTLAQQFP